MQLADQPVVFVVGSRGLLGASVVRHLARSPARVVTATVPWSKPTAALRALATVSGQVVTGTSPWRVLWCAGAGVVGTTEQELDQELAVFHAFLAELSRQIQDRQGSAACGALLLASSAGGVYAGSSGAPFTETTTAVATSAYGRSKLRSESLVEALSDRTGLPTMIARISNLYGPGQDVSKRQGLVSQLCLNHLRRRPSSIYVSLDTARDYLYVDDCARMVLRGVGLSALTGGCTYKVVASEQSLTIAAILGELRRVTRRRPLVVSATSPLTSFQAMNLQFASHVWPELRSEARTTLSAGIRHTLDALTVDLQQGRLLQGS
jgi:UDP-glucose 4-epimerase